MKPFRRTGWFVASFCRCRSAVCGGRGGHSPTRVSLASFSLHRAKRMKSRQRNLYHMKIIKLNSPDAVRKAACQWKKKLDRAQAARALPFPFGRKRKQKGPFCTALRQREHEATIKPVRRTFPNSAAHAASDTWEGSFLPYGQKSPHEPRSEQSAVLPRPSESCLTRR